MDNKDEDAISSGKQPEEEQLDLDPDTLGHAEATQDTASSPDFYEEEEYVDWDEPDRDTSTGGPFALNGSPEYFDGEDEVEDYPPALDDSMDEEQPASDFNQYNEPEEDLEEYVPPALIPEAHQEYEESSEEISEEIDQDEDRPLPMGLIIVGVVAVILLVIGGYGVIQERSDLEEEVRELQAGIATRADPEQLIAAGDRADVLELENRRLKADNEELNEQYRLLSSTVANLQAQLKEQREQEKRSQEQKKQEQAKAEQNAAPQPPAVPQVTAQPVVNGNWFVNFGSYALRETARNWSKRLQPGAGEVIVAPVNSGGKTMYRVRVVGLSSKGEAAQVAKKLEQEHGLDKLWVGRQP
jgi:cell division septation protein DedD